MKAIKSCRQYKYSNRKSIIQSTLLDPINKELVLQLSNYLDLDDQKDNEDAETKAVDNTEIIQEVDDKNEENSTLEDNNIQPIDNKELNADDNDINISEDTDIAEQDKRLDLEDNDEDKQDTVTQSKNEGEEDKKESVTATTYVKEDNRFLTDAILGVLNAEELTSGALRYQVIDNTELWIYYKDDKNLSKLMINIINRLKSCGYNMLEFNRIARSNNAIVFEINKLV